MCGRSGAAQGEQCSSCCRTTRGRLATGAPRPPCPRPPPCRWAIPWVRCCTPSSAPGTLLSAPATCSCRSTTDPQPVRRAAPAPRRRTGAACAATACSFGSACSAAASCTAGSAGAAAAAASIGALLLDACCPRACQHARFACKAGPRRASLHAPWSSACPAHANSDLPHHTHTPAPRILWSFLRQLARQQLRPHLAGPPAARRRRHPAAVALHRAQHPRPGPHPVPAGHLAAAQRNGAVDRLAQG